jgi:chromate transporter
MVALRGALAAAVGVVVDTAWTLIRPHINKVRKLEIASFVVGAVLLAVIFHITPIRILLIAAVIGAVLPPANQP